METLEIQVKDDVKAFDSVEEAVAFIEKIIKRIWDDTRIIDTQIIIRKKRVRGPPSEDDNLKKGKAL